MTRTERLLERLGVVSANVRFRLAPFRIKKRLKEAEATVIVASYAFPTYPTPKDYKTLEEAVDHLEEVWNILDDWGGTYNIQRLETIEKEHEEWRQSHPRKERTGR